MDETDDILTNGHAGMLHDERRHSAYRSAIRTAVLQVHNRGDSVTLLDIGYGTGLLTMFALEAGADTVVACESNETMAEIGQQVVSSNQSKFKEESRVKFENVASTMLEKVNESYRNCFNIIVSEVYDSELVGEGCLETYRHALNNLATSDCIFIPSQATLFAQSVHSPSLSSYSYLNEAVAENRKIHPRISKPWEVNINKISDLDLGEIVEVHRLDFNKRSIDDWTVIRSVTVTHKDREIHGIVLWWSSQIDADNILTTAPIANPQYQGFRDHWMPLFYSLWPQQNHCTIEVEVGDLEIAVRHSTDETCVCQSVESCPIELSLHRYIGMTNCSQLRNAYSGNVLDAMTHKGSVDKFVFTGSRSVKYLIPDSFLRSKFQNCDFTSIDSAKNSIVIDSCIQPECLTAVSHYYRRRLLEKTVHPSSILIPSKAILMLTLVDSAQLYNKSVVPNTIDGFDLSVYGGKLRNCLQSCHGEDMFDPVHLWEYDYASLTKPCEVLSLDGPNRTVKQVLKIDRSGSVTDLILSLGYTFGDITLQFDDSDYFSKVDCFTVVDCVSVEKGDEIVVSFSVLDGQIDKIHLQKL